MNAMRNLYLSLLYRFLSCASHSTVPYMFIYYVNAMALILFSYFQNCVFRIVSNRNSLLFPNKRSQNHITYGLQYQNLVRAFIRSSNCDLRSSFYVIQSEYYDWTWINCSKNDPSHKIHFYYVLQWNPKIY